MGAKFMRDYFYANMFIEQMRKFLKITDQQLDVFYEFPNVIINPLSLDAMNQPPSIIIHNIECLDEILKRYWDTIQNTNIRSTIINESHQLKYYLTNIWRNATNDDYEHPENFFTRMTSFIEDETFHEFDNGKLLDNFIDDDIFVCRKQAKRCFETPYELSFSILSKEKIDILSCLFFVMELHKMKLVGKRLGCMQFKMREIEFLLI